MNKVTAKGMITMLEAFYTLKSTVSLVIVLAKHKNVRMSEKKDITKHLTEYNQIYDEIHILKGTLSKEQKA